MFLGFFAEMGEYLADIIIVLSRTLVFHAMDLAQNRIAVDVLFSYLGTVGPMSLAVCTTANTVS